MHLGYRVSTIVFNLLAIALAIIQIVSATSIKLTGVLVGSIILIVILLIGSFLGIIGAVLLKRKLLLANMIMFILFGILEIAGGIYLCTYFAKFVNAQYLWIGAIPIGVGVLSAIAAVVVGRFSKVINTTSMSKKIGA